jgi:hypothetical protein
LPLAATVNVWIAHWFGKIGRLKEKAALASHPTRVRVARGALLPGQEGVECELRPETPRASSTIHQVRSRSRGGAWARHRCCTASVQ